MKRMTGLILIMLLLLTSCGSSQKVHHIGGRYILDRFLVNGWNAAAFTSDSYLEINGVDSNALSTYYFHFDSSSEDSPSDYIMGNITTYAKTEGMIQYKFWIRSHTGQSEGEMTYFYLYYYPADDTIQVKGNEEIEEWWIKDSNWSK